MLTWSVTGGTFSDGGTVSGTFVQDTASNTTPTWNLSVAGGGASFPARTYAPANSTASTLLLSGGTVPSFLFSASDEPFRGLRLTPASLLDGSVASVALDLAQPNGNVECFNCGPFRLISGGTLVLTSATPTVTLVSAAPSPTTVGVATTVTVTVTGVAAFGPPTGMVTVLDGSSNPLCTITLPDPSCTFTPATAGDQTLVARYEDDANYAVALSNALPLTIAQAPVVAASPATIPTLHEYALGALVLMLAAFGVHRRRR